MKNIIITAASILSLILFLKISALSGNQQQNGPCFSYLHGEIMFNYDPDSNFLHYYKKLSRFARDQQKSKLRRLEEVEINRSLPDEQITNIMSGISQNEKSLDHLGYSSAVNNPLGGSTNEFDQSWSNSIAYLNKTVKTKQPSNYLITTPCGICNNFPIILTSANEIFDNSTYSVNLVRQSFEDENLVYCSPTPEPQTIFLFGSALISLSIFRRFRRKKSAKI